MASGNGNKELFFGIRLTSLNNRGKTLIVKGMLAMSDQEQTFNLRLTGIGINVEKEISRQAALRVMNIVFGGADRGPTASEQDVPNEKDNGRTTLSLREYIDNVGAKKKPDLITAIAHYICEFESQEDFDRDDIRSRFSAAKEPLPGNFGRDFALAQKDGRIAEVHGKKNRFYVTARGIQAIEGGFQSTRKKSAKRAASNS